MVAPGPATLPGDEGSPTRAAGGSCRPRGEIEGLSSAPWRAFDAAKGSIRVLTRPVSLSTCCVNVGTWPGPRSTPAGHEAHGVVAIVGWAGADRAWQTGGSSPRAESQPCRAGGRNPLRYSAADCRAASARAMACRFRRHFLWARFCLDCSFRTLQTLLQVRARGCRRIRSKGTGRLQIEQSLATYSRQIEAGKRECPTVAVQM